MSSARKLYSAVFLIGLMAAGLSLCAAQSPASASPNQSASAPATPQPTTPVASSPATPAAPAQPAAPAAPSDDSVGLTDATPAKKSYTVPAGTKVLLELRSAINTKSAKPGDGVYLSSTFPVVVGNRVMIPTGVYVQGMVDRVQRGGMRAKAQLDMHFTSIIFPNGTVAEIPGVVDNMPGSKNQKVMNDGEGTIQQNGDKGRNAGQAAEIALPTGAGVGTIGGAVSGHPIEGGLAGLGAGLATVGIVSLFTRNADVDIPRGTQVEMVLQRPLVLEEENLAGLSESGAAPTLVPAADQPKPITKHHPRIMCPPGSLGCE
jgi:type IV secretion system protein VirB10